MTAHPGDDVEEDEHCSIAGGVQIFTVTMEINFPLAIPQNGGNLSTLRQSYTTLGYIPKGYSILQQRLA